MLLSRYKLLSINKQSWACAAFVALLRVMQSPFGVNDPASIAALMVEAIQFIPKDFYFPANDSMILNLHGQTGIPSTRVYAKVWGVRGRTCSRASACCWRWRARW